MKRDTHQNDTQHYYSVVMLSVTYADCHQCCVTHNPLYAGCCGTLAFVRMILVRMALMTKNKEITAKQKLCQCRTHAKS